MGITTSVCEVGRGILGSDFIGRWNNLKLSMFADMASEERALRLHRQRDSLVSVIARSEYPQGARRIRNARSSEAAAQATRKSLCSTFALTEVCVHAQDCHDQCAHWSRNDKRGSPMVERVAYLVIARSEATWQSWPLRAGLLAVANGLLSLCVWTGGDALPDTHLCFNTLGGVLQDVRVNTDGVLFQQQDHR